MFTHLVRGTRKHFTLFLLTLVLTACGGGGGGGKDTPLTADAGPDQTVTAGVTVALDGTGSSGDGTITYKWEPEQGTTVTLANAETATPSFVAPNDSVTLAFKLTVTDDDKATATAQ
ncbi:MAG: serine protease, partial [Gammaproteobacteria bacterium]|nr:serine protease [Gammaproteobacteria bacterium]